MCVQISFFAVWFLISFRVQFISRVRRKSNFTAEHQKSKGHEKHDRPLVSKMEFNYQISHISVNVNFYISIHFFQIGLILSKKVSIINGSRNSKNFKVISFFLEVFFSKIVFFFEK